MRSSPIGWVVCAGLFALGTARARAESEDVADVPAESVQIGKDEKKRYVRIGPVGEGKSPPAGHPLLVILPGGDGGEGFRAFCQRILKHACPEDWLAAQVIAPRWTDEQKIVWPSAESRVDGMRFTTGDLIEAVIDDVGKWKKIDEGQVHVLAWSSSGPAVWAHSLSKSPTASRYLIAMSVFKPKQLPARPRVKGRSWYLLHSRDDRVCPYRMVEEGQKFLEKRKARVKLQTYGGGHGWKGNVYGNLRAALEWLSKD